VFELFGVNSSAASLILRLALGTLFIFHGYSKLGAQARKQGAEWMKSMGLPGGMVLFGGTVEFLGGIALLLGILTPIVAALFALWMLSTTWLQVTKMKSKYSGGYEIDITLLFGSLALASLGAGALSFDALLVLGPLFFANVSLSALVLRIGLGSLFVIHGYMKFNAQARERGGQWLKGIGLPASLFLFAGIVEFLGGIALLAGILTQIVAMLFTFWMIILTWLATTKIKKKYMGGWELDLTLLLASLALALVGAGAYSLDALLAI